MASIKFLPNVFVVIATIMINFQALVMADDSDIYTLIPTEPVTSTGSFVHGIPIQTQYTYQGTEPITSTGPWSPAIPVVTVSSHIPANTQPSLWIMSAVPVTTETSTSTTSASSSTLQTSARPPQSGFWTSSDPFSHVRPSTLTDSTTTVTSDDATSTTVDVSTQTSDSSSNSIASTSSSSATVFVVSTGNDETTTAPGPSTSISTHVTWVTASPVDLTTTSSSITEVSGAVSSSQAQSSKGWINVTRLESWLVAAIVVMVYKLF